MAKRVAHAPLELDMRGVSLTDFAQPICLQEKLEVSIVRLLVKVQQITFPLCLVAANGLRPKEPQTHHDIPAWPLRNLPQALADCSLEMPSGITLWPFQDDPNITQEGFVLHGRTPEIRAKVYRFLLQREIPSYVAPCVREHLSWLYDNGPTQFFDFLSLEHLSFQAGPPPAKRRASNLISPQPAASRGPPTPPDFPIFQEEPPRQPGVYASQAERPQGRSPTGPTPPPGLDLTDVLRHQLPFPSLVQEAMRRIAAAKREAMILTQTLQDNPLANHSQEHLCGIRASHTIYAEMEMLEEALGQLL